MRNNKKIFYFAIITALLAMPVVTFAQDESSINAFSPYTFYGIGDLSTTGPAYLRSMGGAGVAFHSPGMSNSLNPASLGATQRNTFLFNFGMEGQNFYSKTVDKKTSYNTFNVRDISVQFSLYKNMGLSVSLNPLSNVGYRVDMMETDPSILANVGSVKYAYRGEGSISQLKVSYGARVFKHLYLGASMVYYKGAISRYYDVEIDPILSGNDYNPTAGTVQEDYSRIGWNVGLDYNIIDTDMRKLIFGMTFSPKLNLKPLVNNSVYGGSTTIDTAYYSMGTKNFNLPMNIRAGLFYMANKFSAGLDYSFQHWKGMNGADVVNGIAFGNTHTVSGGVQFLPNHNDMHRFYNRWSYRLGGRYSDYYMTINGHKVRDYAITFGVGIPLKAQGYSSINIGAELGRRGNTATGTYGTRQFNMVRENYFKINIEFSLFGEDFWFMKHRYN